MLDPAISKAIQLAKSGTKKSSDEIVQRILDVINKDYNPNDVEKVYNKFNSYLDRFIVDENGRHPMVDTFSPKFDEFAYNLQKALDYLDLKKYGSSSSYRDLVNYDKSLGKFNKKESKIDKKLKKGGPKLQEKYADYLLSRDPEFNKEKVSIEDFGSEFDPEMESFDLEKNELINALKDKIDISNLDDKSIWDALHPFDKHYRRMDTQRRYLDDIEGYGKSDLEEFLDNLFQK